MKKLFLAVAIFATATLTAQQRPTCKGTTKAGQSCKSTIILKTGFCRAHDPNTPKCKATTTSGKPCQMTVKATGERCRHHQGQTKATK